MAGWWFTTTHMATKHDWVMIYHNTYMVTKHGWVVIYHNAYGHQTWLGDDLPHRIWPPNMVGWWLPQRIWPPNMAGWWFTTTHMATKHDWVIIYHDRIPTIMTMWLSETKRQTKIIISPLPQCLRPPNLAVLWLILRDFCPFSHITLSLHGLARSRENFISLLPQ